MKYITITALSAASLFGQSVSLQFSNFNDGNTITSGLVDSAGTASGLTWGILVDNVNNGFDTGSFTGVNLSNTGGAWQQLSTVAGSSDDMIWLSDPTDNALAGTNGPTFDATGLVANGAPGSIANLPSVLVDTAGNANSGTAFQLIWFENGNTFSDGDEYYTFQSDPLFTLPSPGGGFTPVIVGAIDPNDVSAFTFQTAPIPEPTSVALLGLGGLALIGRRKRA